MVALVGTNSLPTITLQTPNANAVVQARHRWITSEPGRYLITVKSTDSNGAVALTAAIMIDMPGLPTKVSQNKRSHEYDALNRVMQVTYAGRSPTAIEYDGGASPQPNDVGRLTNVRDESGNTCYFYHLTHQAVAASSSQSHLC
jgi:hypothetical protein